MTWIQYIAVGLSLFFSPISLLGETFTLVGAYLKAIAITIDTTIRNATK